jgi:TPR repeat protein
MNGRGIKKDEKLGYAWFLMSAMNGHHRSQYHVGMCLSKGQGTPKNIAEAIKWHMTAANSGYGKSQYFIAQCYSEGRGVEKDDKKALEWYLKAASTGHVLAQYYAGHHYANGIGVKPDEETAVKWYTRAAKQGHTYSRQLIEECFGKAVKQSKDMTPFEKHMDEAAQGDAEAQFIMGRYYEEGIGVEKDLNEAKKWYTKAAVQGHFNAKKKMTIYLKQQK